MRKTFPNSGVISLLTSIIVALLLIVIVISGLRIMSSELRQASDFDLSVKAYFAAESGLEDAIDVVRAQGIAAATSKSGCTPYSSTDANLSGDSVIAYTCQTVTLNENNVTGELDKEATTQIDLAGAAATFNKIKISWNLEGTTDPNNSSWSAIPTAFPPGSGWADTYPAVIETNFVAYHKGSFSSSDIRSKTVVLKPSGAPNTSTEVTLASANNPEPAQCVASTSPGVYECSRTINIGSFADAASYNYVINLHGRYSSTNYKIEAFNDSTPVDIPSQLVIDVTGKAGDVFRRIQAKALLGRASPLPFSILTDDNICKVLSVTGGIASSDTGCSP